MKYLAVFLKGNFLKTVVDLIAEAKAALLAQECSGTGCTALNRGERAFH
jgi:hypothetical protein